MIFECEFDISLKVASARFTFSLKVNVPNMLMNLTCTQTSNNFLMKLIKVIVKYCIYNELLLFVAFVKQKRGQ